MIMGKISLLANLVNTLQKQSMTAINHEYN